MPTIPFDKGYTCVCQKGVWNIVDRYGERIEGEATLSDGFAARKRADILNEEMIEKRFNDR